MDRVHDAAAVEVQDGGQIEPSLIGLDVGDVGEPERFGAAAVKLRSSRFGAIGRA
jgi:hypothetical protein